jgi:hypothetical protein
MGCEYVGRYKRRNPKPTTLVFDIPENSEIHTHRFVAGLPRIDTITLKITAKWRPPHLSWFQYERTNPVGVAVQIMKEYTDDDGNVYHYYTNIYCDECGGIIRYDERGFLVCEDCGLLHSNSPTIGKEILFAQRARKITGNERKRWPSVTTNRYGSFRSDADSSTFDRVFSQLMRWRLNHKQLVGYEVIADELKRREPNKKIIARRTRRDRRAKKKGYEPNPIDAVQEELNFLDMKSRRALHDRKSILRAKIMSI